MKILADGRTFEGTPEEILEQLRIYLDDPDVNDLDGYIGHVRDVFARFLGIPLELPAEAVTSTEKSACVMDRIRSVGLLEMLEEKTHE